jgi:hypothetical protein
METNLSIDAIVQLVTREVMRELSRRGIGGKSGLETAKTNGPDARASERLDMSKFKTPIITEQALSRLHERTEAVVVPFGTIVTPRAKELLRERSISVVFE